ncbi:hypothetical protein N0V90_001821 [Kalmusia sp. IMI 367209]|nr:hypothetical protein N0V90_001821 [Kalmusia sp. IMI 367209]
MTDTPRSEKSQTRYSTPVSDLDDHRHQPASMPRADTSPTRSRRPTFASIQALPERATPLQLVNEALEVHNVTARDFETAVVDDDEMHLSPDDVFGKARSAEEDVCFPVQEDTGKTTRFDYEELEEFVAESQTKTPIGNLHRKSSVESRLSKTKPRIFNDLRPKSSHSTTPKMDADAMTVKETIDPAMQEKLAEEGLAHMFTSDKQTIQPALNRWTFFSSELDDTIHAAELGGLLMPGERFSDLFEPPSDTGVWWLDMVNPTEEEVFAICKAFGVHPLTREDIAIQEPREKVELFHQYYFVCFRSFYQTDKEHEDYLEPINFYAVVFKEGILSFTFTESPHALNVRKRIGRLRDYINLNADWICYALIDDIVDSFAPVLRTIEQETDTIEDQVFIARIEDSREILRAIGDCRKKVMQLLRLLGGKADVIKGFAKRCNESYSVAPRGDVGLYLSDIQDHVVTMMSNLGHFEKMLSRSHSNYLAQISVDQVIQGNQSNVTLGKVTVIATILVPLNLICGLFGMNVKVPGQDGSLGWFFGILGTIVLFVAVCLGTAKRMRYI